MSALKRLLLVACAFVSISALSIAQTHGERLAGELSFGFAEANLGIGVVYVHPLEDWLELGGEVTYFLPHSGNSTLGVDVNDCFWLVMANAYATFDQIEGANVYGIGGLNLVNWTRSTYFVGSGDEYEDGAQSENKIGGQIGIGANRIFGDDILVHFELMIPFGGANAWFKVIAQAGARVPIF